MSALFNFHSFLTVVLLVICTCTYVKMQFPYVLDRKTGFRGFFWKAARIGGLLSGYAGSLTKRNDDGVTCLLLIYNVFAKIQLLLLFIFGMFFVITEFIKKLFRVAKPVRVTALT